MGFFFFSVVFNGNFFFLWAPVLSSTLTFKGGDFGVRGTLLLFCVFFFHYPP